MGLMRSSVFSTTVHNVSTRQIFYRNSVRFEVLLGNTFGDNKNLYLFGFFAFQVAETFPSLIEFYGGQPKVAANYSNLLIDHYITLPKTQSNRPLIMILDQVSFKQGRQTFFRVCNAIHKYLEDELFMMADMLLSEEASLEALVSRTPMRIDFKKLKQSGFYFTSEPFFRGLLLAIHYYTLKSQLFKAKVEIPLDQGRTMYGVLDETGVLQYGQVFIQYSVDKNKPGEELKIMTGRVMVTKNPCIVPGDVRLFCAVDKAALRHLFDVIVFPSNGPRSHTDEMAGFRSKSTGLATNISVLR